jgi:outer membrane protein TolC
VHAQDTLHLAPLQAAAVRHDPRAKQPELLRSATEYRLAVLASERLPQLELDGWASHQSDVTSIPISLPGVSVRRPADERWETAVEMRQLIWDGGDVSLRRDLERARLAESAAGVDVALYQLREDVNTAFFAAFLMQQQAAEYNALLSDLAARVTAVRARVNAGTALRREAAEIEAEEVRAMQGRDQAQAGRRAALGNLASLVGRPVDTSAVLMLPDEAPEETHTGSPGKLGALRSRPEFRRINLSRERLEREAALTKVENAPRIFAFGQAGAGTPGLDQFRTDASVYWQAGVRLEWRPWTWGSARRNAAAIRDEQQVLETEERALAAALSRVAVSDLEEIARLRRDKEADERVIALRVDIEQQARAQHDEGVITAADYVETRTDVLEARLALQRHLVELARARAGFLTTLGLAFPITGPTP